MPMLKQCLGTYCFALLIISPFFYGTYLFVNAQGLRLFEVRNAGLAPVVSKTFSGLVGMLCWCKEPMSFCIYVGARQVYQALKYLIKCYF